MRSWRTPTGELIVEGAPVPTHTVGGPIRTGAGQPLAEAHVYYRLDTAGDVLEIYDRSEYALDDYVYGQVHQVLGDTLHSFFTSIRTGRGGFDQEDRQQAIVAGLVEVPAADSTLTWSGVSAALDAHRHRQPVPPVTARGAEAAIRASVTPALADLPAGVGVDLEFGYDDAALLRHRDGAVIWRDDTGWPYRGKDLHRLLGDLLRERLGERLHSFREDTPWWYWDAWE